MKQLSKALAVFINLCNYGAGIAVALILILRADFTSIFYINSMTTNESLFFNMILFEAGLAMLGVVLVLLTREYKKLNLVIKLRYDIICYFFNWHVAICYSICILCI